jgi:hypothetical protein
MGVKTATGTEQECRRVFVVMPLLNSPAIRADMQPLLCQAHEECRNSSAAKSDPLFDEVRGVQRGQWKQHA